MKPIWHEPIIATTLSAPYFQTIFPELQTLLLHHYRDESHHLLGLNGLQWQEVQAMCPICKTKLTIGKNVSFSTIPYIFEGFKRLPCCERKECTCEGNGVENVEEEFN